MGSFMCNPPLAKMKHYGAQLAINTAILEHYKEDDDWLSDDMPYVLAHMGVGAIQTLTALVRYGDTDRSVRFGAAIALMMIAIENPEEKPGIVTSIKDVAEHEDDIETRTVLAVTLLDLKDPDLYEYTKNLLETGFISKDHVSLKELDHIYEELLNAPYCDARDPLYTFMYYFDSHRKHNDDISKAKSRDAPKIGRNDPCSCGSGKKYKKCCLSMT